VGDRIEAGLPAASTEDRLDVRRVLGDLPRRQREVVVLHYYLGLPVLEIAETLGVSEGTVKSTLFRARHAMAVALGEDEG
jgi:RNA polymerase sigma-70 factor (ECF subfamily)